MGAPDPAAAARLTRAQISAVLKRARRRDRDTKTTLLKSALRTEQLSQPPLITAAHAGTVRALVAVIVILNEQVTALEGQATQPTPPMSGCFPQRMTMRSCGSCARSLKTAPRGAPMLPA